MCSNSKYSMLKDARQVSFFNYPKLVGTANLGIKTSPKSIAHKMNLVTERSFDDFGYFDLFALKLNNGIIAFRQYTANPAQYSYVSYLGFEKNEVRGLLPELLGDTEVEVIELDGEW